MQIVLYIYIVGENVTLKLGFSTKFNKIQNIKNLNFNTKILIKIVTQFNVIESEY